MKGMIFMDKLNYLITELINEEPEYRNIVIPTNNTDKRNLLRSLMNVRPPKGISKQFLKIQDEFLKEEASKKGITDADSLPYISERISLWQGDITSLKCGAIVNAANSAMLGCFVPCHRCIDNAIHTFSGIQLRLECNRIMSAQAHEEPTGSAKITRAYNLPSEYILHTVGPIVTGTLTQKHCDLLKSCYLSCLKLAEEYNIKSVAFCCISTGEFHFPNDRAAEIAVNTVREYLKNSKIERVVFNVFKDEDKNIYQKLLKSN